VYKQVTFLGDVHFPTLSPDGRHLAYSVRKDEGTFGLWVKDLDTDSAIEIYSAPRFWIEDWSPDGSRLLFGAIHSDTDMGTYVLPRLGGEPRKILDHPWPYSSWSADGRQIAHLHVGDNEISIFDLSTGETRFFPLRLERGESADVSGLDWSATHDLILLQIDDTEHQSFWTIKPDGTKQSLLMKIKYDPKSLIINPHWSPKGDAIYYFRYGVRGQGVMDLKKIPVDTKTGMKTGDPVTVLSGLHTSEMTFSISRDGTQFLYVQETQYSNIWMMTVDGEEGALDVNKVQLTTGETWKSRTEISPDGRRIVFGMSSGEASNIYVMTLPEKTDESQSIEQPQQLTFFNSLSDFPAWSPDGSEIAFCSAQGGTPRVWHMSSDGGTPKPFDGTELQFFSTDYLTWAPGRHILYRSRGVRNFTMFDPATGERSPLVEADSLGYIFDPCWSPDGNRIAFFWNREREDPPMGAWVKDVTDGTMWKIADTVVDPIGWTSDGEWIWGMLYDMTGGWSNEVFKIPAGGGTPVSWVELPFDEVDSYRLSMTPDGRKFVYSKSERHADAWIIENFDPDIE
jgi:TolB protein